MGHITDRLYDLRNIKAEVTNALDQCNIITTVKGKN
jgi:hypothetical protein